MVHAFVECRARGGRWWLYAQPALSLDDRVAALLLGEGVDAEDPVLNGFGVPHDASPAVVDEYTWAVEGPDTDEQADLVGAREAAAWLSRGVSRPWSTREPFARVSDPRWEHATWMGRAELDHVLARYEATAGQPAPATFCALRAMMRELERDFLVRLVVWFERLQVTAAEPSSASMVMRGRGARR